MKIQVAELLLRLSLLPTGRAQLIRNLGRPFLGPVLIRISGQGGH